MKKSGSHAKKIHAYQFLKTRRLFLHSRRLFINLRRLFKEKPIGLKMDSRRF